MDFRNLPPVKEQIMKCVRCGKCRSVCPVFDEIRNETAAPGATSLWFRCYGTGTWTPSRKYMID